MTPLGALRIVRPLSALGRSEHGRSMADERDPHDFRSLDDRLKAAQARRAANRGDGGKGGGLPGNLLGMAYRIGVELAVAPLVGGGLGWLLDSWLGTRPWCFVVFVVLGCIAGVMNVMRTMRTMGMGGPKGGPET